MDLSQLSEDTRRELVDLEIQLASNTLTRGSRRQLQNKRNKLKARIKANLLTGEQEAKLAELKIEEKELKAILEETQYNREHVKSLKMEQTILKAQLGRQEHILKDLQDNVNIYKIAYRHLTNKT